MDSDGQQAPEVELSSTIPYHSFTEAKIKGLATLLQWQIHWSHLVLYFHMSISSNLYISPYLHISTHTFDSLRLFPWHGITIDGGTEILADWSKQSLSASCWHC